ncbi:MAG TPA: lasso peptide biosynthesis B2 protein [Thermoleophilaceae bacterium]
MSDLATTTRLSAPEKAALAAEVLAAYVHGRWHLRRQGVREAVAAQRAVTVRPAATDDTVAAGRRLGRVVRRSLAVVPADTRCLAQSLTLTRMLARRGIDSRLVIGVRPGERFAAHAWVEHEGVPLLPPGTSGFEEIVTL